MCLAHRSELSLKSRAVCLFSAPLFLFLFLVVSSGFPLSTSVFSFAGKNFIFLLALASHLVAELPHQCWHVLRLGAAETWRHNIAMHSGVSLPTALPLPLKSKCGGLSLLINTLMFVRGAVCPLWDSPPVVVEGGSKWRCDGGREREGERKRIGGRQVGCVGVGVYTPKPTFIEDGWYRQGHGQAVAPCRRASSRSGTRAGVP